MRVLLPITIVGSCLLGLGACRTTNERQKSDTTHPVPTTQNTTDTSNGVIAETNTDFVKGNPQAPLRLEYYADLQCGACRAMSPVLDDMQKKYPEKILWVFKNYPKDTSCSDYQGQYLHEYSCEAAVATRCVGLGKDKFWEMKDRVFANQSATKPETLKEWALSFGLTAEQYDACFALPAVLDKVKADIAEGKGKGVAGTPTIYINNVKIYPATKDKVEAEIKKQLKL